MRSVNGNEERGCKYLSFSNRNQYADYCEVGSDGVWVVVPCGRNAKCRPKRHLRKMKYNCDHRAPFPEMTAQAVVHEGVSEVFEVFGAEELFFSESKEVENKIEQANVKLRKILKNYKGKKVIGAGFRLKNFNRNYMAKIEGVQNRTNYFKKIFDGTEVGIILFNNEKLNTIAYYDLYKNKFVTTKEAYPECD